MPLCRILVCPAKPEEIISVLEVWEGSNSNAENKKPNVYYIEENTDKIQKISKVSTINITRFAI